MLKSHLVTLCLILFLFKIDGAVLSPYETLNQKILIKSEKNLQSTNMNKSMTSIGQDEAREKLDRNGKDMEDSQNHRKHGSYKLKNFKFNFKIFSNASTIAIHNKTNALDQNEKSLNFGKNNTSRDDGIYKKKVQFLKDKNGHVNRTNASVIRELKRSILTGNNEQHVEKVHDTSEPPKNAKESNETLLLEMALLKTKLRKHQNDFRFKKNLDLVSPENHDVTHQDKEEKSVKEIDQPIGQIKVKNKKFNPKMALRETFTLHINDNTLDKFPRDKCRHSGGSWNENFIDVEDKSEFHKNHNGNLPDLKKRDEYDLNSLDFVAHAPPKVTRPDVEDDRMDHNAIDPGTFDDYQNTNMDSADKSFETSPLEYDTGHDSLKNNQKEVRRIFKDNFKSSDPPKIVFYSMKHKTEAKDSEKGHSEIITTEEMEKKRLQIAKLMDLVDTIPDGVIIIKKPRIHSRREEPNAGRVENTFNTDTQMEKTFEAASDKPNLEQEFQNIKQRSDDDDHRKSWRDEIEHYINENQKDQFKKQCNKDTYNKIEYFKPNNTHNSEDYSKQNNYKNNLAKTGIEYNHYRRTPKPVDSKKEKKIEQTVERRTSQDRELDIIDSGNEAKVTAWRRSKSDISKSKEKLGVGCIKLLYDGVSKGTEGKPARFRPKFMTKNPVTTLFLKFRWITTTQASYPNLKHCQCCPKRFQKP